MSHPGHKLIFAVVISLGLLFSGCPVLVTKSTSKEITAFGFASPQITGTIDEAAKTILLQVPFGTDLAALVPAITHTGVSISPGSGQACDFTQSVIFTVTAEDTTTRAYSVTVTVAPDSSKEITAFSFFSPAVSGTITGTSIAVTVPFGTDLAALIPTISHTGVSASPASGEARDFSNPVTYVITAADGSTASYTVTVSHAAVSYSGIPATWNGYYGDSAHPSVPLYSIHGGIIWTNPGTSESQAFPISAALGGNAYSYSYKDNQCSASFFGTKTHAWDRDPTTGNITFSMLSTDYTTGMASLAVVATLVPLATADLCALYGDTGTLDPVFSAANTVYELRVPKGTSSVTITGEAVDAKAMAPEPVRVDNIVEELPQTVSITVTASDGSQKTYTITVTVGVSMPLVTVESGSFNNGASQVTLSAFMIGKYDVTRRQYKAIMGTDPSIITSSSGLSDPVQNVSWNDAVEFCNKLSIEKGLTPVYVITDSGVETTWTNNGFRLPTEAEWEFAAQGGNLTQGYTWAGSNNVDDVAWYGGGTGSGTGNSNHSTHPVGSKAPNELGLYDMSGNVWQWCHDWFGPYPGDPQTDPKGEFAGTMHSLRGGCWHDYPSYASVKSRYQFTPWLFLTDDPGGRGFRVARSIPETMLEPTAPLVPNPLKMLPVAGGSFNNGSSQVVVSSFTMSKTEITQGQYITVMGSNPASGLGVGWEYPVYRINWYHAVDFCNRLSLREGKTPCYSYIGYGTNSVIWPAGWNTAEENNSITCNFQANGYRLPTEAEFEYAARGGALSNGYTWSGSNTADEVAWTAENSGDTCHVVGTKAPNELGFYDMSGNVVECCNDWYGDYASGSQTDPTGALSGEFRVMRGGCWWVSSSYATLASRDFTNPYSIQNYYPTGSNHVVGFRIVCRN